MFEEVRKPAFNVDQVVSASIASKRFGEVRKQAKVKPQFISDNNKIDSVLMGYEEYERMYNELEVLKEMLWAKEIEARILAADQNGATYALDEVMTAEEKAQYDVINPDEIADEDLFE